MPQPTLTAYVIAYNEEAKIEAAVSSILWADEIVVADSHSTDRTAEIAASLGAKVVQIEFEGFGRLRNAALEHCRGDWIFSLDADERCTLEARDEILRVIGDPESADIYLVPRRNWFMGRWIRFSGWRNDYRQPQLFRKGAMRYDEKPVHEGWIARPGARVGRLRSAIRQVPFDSLEEILEKANRYSTLGSVRLADAGRKGSMLAAVVRGVAAFTRHYFVKLGFLDGWAGFVIALGNAEGTFYKYAKLHERRKDRRPPAAERLERPERLRR